MQKGCVLTMHVLYPHITFWIGHKVYCVMTIPERQNNPQFAVLVRLSIFAEGIQQVQTPMDLEMPPTYEGSALLYQQLQQTDNGTMSKKQLRRFAQELCNVNSKLWVCNVEINKSNDPFPTKHLIQGSYVRAVDGLKFNKELLV